MNPAPKCSQCPNPLSRRLWIKGLAMSCGVMAGVQKGVFEPRAFALNDTRDRLRIDLSLLPSLDLNSGSAMISYDGEQTVMLINRESETQYHVLDPRCTHQGCRVDPYTVSTGSSVCPCHQSEYDLTGRVTQGPAVNDLNRYQAQLEGASTLVIEIGGFFHRIDSIALQSSTPTETRLRITFPTINGAKYQLRHASSLEEPFNIIGFATSPAGPVNQSLFAANGTQASLYVGAAGSTGFFQLELMVYQIA